MSVPTPVYQDEAVTLWQGDCRGVLADLDDRCVDALVTDPPAGIAFMGHEWDNPWEYDIGESGADNPGARHRVGVRASRNAVCRRCRGMRYGRKELRSPKDRPGCACEQPDWDDGDRAIRARQQFIGVMTAVFTECRRVLKPGGHALVWGLPRTSHWTATALEDAGFEIRDCISHFYDGQPQWTAFLQSLSPEQRELFERAVPDNSILSHLTGQGFPKGLRPVPHMWDNALQWLLSERVPCVVQSSRCIQVNLPKAKAPIALALARILPADAPALLMEIGRVDGSSALMAISLSETEAKQVAIDLNTTSSWKGSSGVRYDEVSRSTTGPELGTITIPRISNWLTGPVILETIIPTSVTLRNGLQLPACVVAEHLNGSAHGLNDTPVLTALGDASSNPLVKWSGWNVALKPSAEFWWLCRAPLSEPTVAANVARWSTGALNIAATRIRTGEDLGRTNHTTSTYYDSHNGSRPPHPHTITIDNSTGKGRWPANAVLSHTLFCEQVGTRQVRASGPTTGISYSQGPNGGTCHVGWQRPAHADYAPRGQTSYADAAGLETVEAWACAPDCPVALLDAQSGRTSTTGRRSARSQAAVVNGTHWGTDNHRSTEYPGESGGASRFYATFGPDSRQCFNCGAPIQYNDAWESTDRHPVTHQASDTPPEKATTASLFGTLLPNGPEASSLTSGSGNSHTDQSREATRSTISTRTSKTTGSKTSSSWTPSRIKDFIAAANSETGNGGSPAICVACSSQLPPSTGISQSKDGRSMGGADNAIAERCATTGGAVRFAYIPKPSRRERDLGLPPGVHSQHPTVKSIALMRWLVRLVTPPGGTVLDPFAGSGSTLLAARAEGFHAYGIEQSPDYCTIAAGRLRAGWSLDEALA